MNLAEKLKNLKNVAGPSAIAIDWVTEKLIEAAKAGKSKMNINKGEFMDEKLSVYLRNQGLSVCFNADQRDGDYYEISW